MPGNKIRKRRTSRIKSMTRDPGAGLTEAGYRFCFGEAARGAGRHAGLTEAGYRFSSGEAARGIGRRGPKP